MPLARFTPASTKREEHTENLQSCQFASIPRPLRIRLSLLTPPPQPLTLHLPFPRHSALLRWLALCCFLVQPGCPSTLAYLARLQLPAAALPARLSLWTSPSQPLTVLV